MLRLKAPNHCAIVAETESYKGMLRVVKDACTWGEIEKDTLMELLRRRLRLKGNKRLDEKTLKEITGFNGYEELAEALLQGKVR